MSPLQHFVLPDLGEGLAEAELVAWHVAVGDEVALNQVLVEVETEKAVVELPSPFVGTVVELLAAAGETVSVGAPLIAIESAAHRSDRPRAQPADAGRGRREGADAGGLRPVRGASEPPAPQRQRAPGAHPGHRRPRPPRRPLAAPPVRFMARQNGVDLADVNGNGPGGIITREDLAAHLAGSAAPDGSERETRTPVRGVQKHMAEAMVRSVATAPQACVFLTVDATPTVELVDRLRDNRHFEGLHVTPLAVVARAVVLALRDHPSLNSSWDETSDEVVTKRYVHLGIAVAGPRGLVVPNIKDAQELTLRGLTAALADLTATARAGRTAPADLRDGTITVTNIGVFGVDAGVPILNPGEAAILAVGSLQRRPWEYEGELALRHLVTLSLAFDHRLVDGQAAALFLRDVGESWPTPPTSSPGADPSHLP